MKRRRYLLATGLVGSLGLFGVGRGSREPPLRVTVWFSERAATHEVLSDRVSGYLGRALRATRDDVQIGFGDHPIPLDAEEGTHLMTVEWPQRVLAGAVGRGPVRPVGDVNLLITDGDPGTSPAGYGMRGIAASTGARHLASMPPIEDSLTVVDHSLRAAVTQLLLHECGHALGLEHAHGSVRAEGDTVVATPMIGAYAWAEDDVRHRQLGRDANRCGAGFPTADVTHQQLELLYGPCARRAITSYEGGLLG